MTLAGRFRYGVKRGLEIAIVRSGITAWRIRDPKRARLVLAYHNIVADDDPPWGERALHLKRSLFERHIDLLGEKGRIVPLTELLQDGPSEDNQAPRFALTFDDAYQGALDTIESFLQPRGIPCTVFVNPALLGKGAFWWDQVAEVFDGAMPEALRQDLLFGLKGCHEGVTQHMGEALRMVPDPPSSSFAPSSESSLRRILVARSGMDLGLHTWSHRNLSALSEEEVVEEVSRNQVWLAKLGAKASPFLAYPYGLAPVPMPHGLASLGIKYGLLVEGGHLQSPLGGPYGLLLPRLSVPNGLSREGLQLRLAGIR